MVRTTCKPGTGSKNKSYKRGRDTKRRNRDVDQIHDDIAKIADKGPQPIEYDDDIPGGGQFYVVETGRHFTDQRGVDDHKKSRLYKRRLKELKEQKQYTQFEAEWAAGMSKEVLPPAHGAAKETMAE
ncbi:zinc finger protein 593-like protein [Pelagophyceae sp. CCMP2097]|nr:zinc finger protein 593-like protein [Pelagophyceae sp. CCMP2097]